MPFWNRRYYLLCMVMMGASSCFTPVNTSFERAASLEKDEIELGGSLSSNYVSVQDRFGATNLGLRSGYGLNHWLDLKLNYRLLLNDDENLSIQYFSFYPKTTFIPNTLAFSPEIGLYLFGGGGGSEGTFVFSPRLNYSAALSETVELSLSSKLDFFLDGNTDVLWGFNMGWAIDTSKGSKSIRPEIGLLVLPGQQPALFTFGLAYVRILE